MADQAQLRQKLIEVVADLQVVIAAMEPPPANPAPVPGGHGPICWGAKVSKDFRDSVLWIEGNGGPKANFLMPCMAFETGLTFSPSKRNPASSATGLIQFMDATAKGLGTTTAKLAAMSPVRQLAYVYRYFKRFNGIEHWDLADTYMAILLPSMIGEPLDTSMKWPSKAYAVNKGLDLDKNGNITKREAVNRVLTLYTLGMQPENMA